MPFKSVDSLKTQSLKPFLLPWINYFFLRISISAENLAGGTRDTIRSILAGESTLSGILTTSNMNISTHAWATIHNDFSMN